MFIVATNKNTSRSVNEADVFCLLAQVTRKCCLNKLTHQDKQMTTKTGLFNFKHCMEVEIPSLPNSAVLSTLADRLCHDMFTGPIIQNKFPVKLINDAIMAAEKYQDTHKLPLRLSLNMQRNLWNAYVMAYWDIQVLNKSVVDERGYIKYKATDYIPRHKPPLSQQDLAEQDHWDMDFPVTLRPTLKYLKQQYEHYSGE